MSLPILFSWLKVFFIFLISQFNIIGCHDYNKKTVVVFKAVINLIKKIYCKCQLIIKVFDYSFDYSYLIFLFPLL